MAVHLKIDLPEADYLYVQESGIKDAGLGLFTAIPIYKDEVIAVFKGRVLSQQQAQKRVLNKEDQYFMNLPNGFVFDTSRTKCFAKYANDANGSLGTSMKNNAKIFLDDSQKIVLVAIKKIKAGEEIFCSYGKKYWEKHSLHQ